MRFSIIVPIYNVGAYLPGCIQSIKAQTYQDYQVILVDDGSKDISKNLCDEYAASDKRVHVIHKENGGLVSARKAGCELASGDYIINIDGDDSVKSDFLEKISYDLDKFSCPDMLVYGYTMTKNGDEKSVLSKIPAGSYFGDELSKIRYSYLYDPSEKGINSGALLFSIWSKAVKREIYCHCQKQVSDGIVHGEDLILTFLLLNCINSIGLSGYTGYEYRTDNVNSIMNTRSERDFEYMDILVDNLYLFFENDNQYRNQINVYVLYRTLELLIRYARKNSSYKSFKKHIAFIKNNNLVNKCRKVKLKKHTVKSRILVLLFKLKLWKFLHMYVRKKCQG